MSLKDLLSRFVLSPLKRRMWRMIPRQMRKQLTNCQVLAYEYGQYRTIKEWACLDSANQPIPWYTYPCIDFLNSLDLQKLHVFEYGSGFSSLYYARRAASVTCIEDNHEWFHKVHLDSQEKITAHLIETESDYVKALHNVKHDLDIIVIDGSARPDCVDTVLKYLENHSCSMIIFDNSDWFPKALDRLQNALGWIRVPFRGFGPINNYCWETSVIINPNATLTRVADKSIAFGQTLKMATIPSDR